MTTPQERDSGLQAVAQEMLAKHRAKCEVQKAATAVEKLIPPEIEAKLQDLENKATEIEVLEAYAATLGEPGFTVKPEETYVGKDVPLDACVLAPSQKEHLDFVDQQVLASYEKALLHDCQIIQEVSPSGGHRLIMESNEGLTAVISPWAEHTGLSQLTCPKTGKVYCGVTDHYGTQFPRVFTIEKVNFSERRVR